MDLQSRQSSDKRGMTLAASGLEEREPAVDPAVIQRKLNRHLVPWLFCFGIFAYLDRTNLSFAALELNRDLKLSCRTYGLGASLFFVCYAALQVPSAMACARFGAPFWLSMCTIAFGTVTVAFAAATSVPAFLVLRFLLGATESTAFPGMFYHLSIFYSERELGPAYAKVSSCTALAQVVGAPLAAAILSMDGLAGLRGWQWLFVLEGVATVAFGAALRLCLAHSPARAHRVLTHAEREWLCGQKAAEREAAGAKGPQPGRLQAALGVIRDWRVLWLAACWLLVAAVMFGLVFFMPLLVGAMFSGGALSAGAGAHRGGACGGGSHSISSSAGDSKRSALVALATAAPFVVGALAMQLNARLAERANERHRHAGIPIVLAAATMLLTPPALGAAGPGLAFALLTLAAGLAWSFHGPFFSWPAVFLPGEQASAGFAFINSCGAVGGFLGPYILGVLSDRADGGFGASFVVLAIFLGLAGAGILLFPAPGHKERGPHYEPPAGRCLKVLEEGEEGEEGSGSGGSGLGSEAGTRDSSPSRPRPRLKASGSGRRLQQEVECQPILPPAAGRSD